MKITYLGQCTFLFDDGNTRIVSDPYLTRSLDNDVWKSNYPAPCDLYSLDPDAVIISHSHDDHMNIETLKAYREKGGDCVFIAPYPECGPLRELGFSHVIGARAEETYTAKHAAITAIMCAHTEPHTDDLGRFRELSYFIKMGGRTVFFGGDCSLYDGLIKRLNAEKPCHVIIPCNGRDDERTSSGIIGNTTEEEAALIARETGAVLIPSHYDLYDNNGCPVEKIKAAAEKQGAELLLFDPGQTREI